MNKIDEAVVKCAEAIAKAQAMSRALNIIIDYLNEKTTTNYQYDERSKSLYVLKDAIHQRIINEWNKLSYLSPIHQEANKILHERAKSWFSVENSEIMSFLGETGSYKVVDEETFREELKYVFGITE